MNAILMVFVQKKVIYNMDEYRRIYENNKRLDITFFERYQNTPDFFKKNCIELLVELGEFANETKCFNYWSITEPNKEKILEEYADCITMVLVFFNISNLEIEEYYNHIESKNLLDVLNHLYELSVTLMNNYSTQTVKDIFGNLLYVGEILNLKQEEIINSIDEKYKIIEKRLNSEY